MEIFRLFGSVFVDNAEANQSLAKTDENAQKVGRTLQDTIRVARQWGAEMGKQLTAAGSNIARRAGVPLAALTAGMIGLAKATADYGDRVAKASQEIGLSVQAYQELEYALGQNGVATAEFEMAIGNLNRRLGEARRGNQKYRDTLKGMGVDLKALDAGTVTTEDGFMQIVQALSEMDDAQMQASLASEFFGTKVARKLMPAIRGGAEGIDALRKRAHDLGIVMDEQAARKSELFGDTMDDLSRTMGGFSRTIGSELQAPMINIAKWITNILGRAGNWIKENPKLVRQIVMVTGAIAGVLGVLVTLGTTMIITGKIIGALGVVFNILTSKPMLIIAAIGLLWLAWDRDWGGIRTKTETVWKALEPIFGSMWDWLQKAWKWTLEFAGDVWTWLRESAWPWLEKTAETVWKWTAELAGIVWAWLRDTAWPWLSKAAATAWAWTLTAAGDAWLWIKNTAWPWLSKAAATAWVWTLTALGDAWLWLKDTAWPWLTQAAATAWTWTINALGDAWAWLRDTGWPWLTKAASTAWTWTLTALGDAWLWLRDTAWPWLTKAAATAWAWTLTAAGDAWLWIKNTAWPWLSKAAATVWTWTLTAIGDAWLWLKDTAWPWLAKAAATVWTWTLTAAGDAWLWLKDTAWPWLSKAAATAWEWTLTALGDVWLWLKDTAWPWLSKAAATVWTWTLTALGDAWLWLKDTAWPWLAKAAATAWTWTITALGDAWVWLRDTGWPWLTKAAATTWTWTINALGDAWEWLTDTTWAEKWKDIKDWLTDGWTWAIGTAGDAWDWFLSTDLGKWLDDLRAKIAESKAWKWIIDVALPPVIEAGEAVIRAVVEASGKMYDAIKKGFDTGDWSDFWVVASEVWSKGITVLLGLQLASQTATAILTAIGSLFGNTAGKLGIGGIPLAIGLLSVGLQLKEAQIEGSYDAFVRNVLVAALTGAIGGAAFGPSGALMGFNLAINLRLGEVLEGAGKTIAEKLGIPKGHMTDLEEYEAYRTAQIEEATRGMTWFQKLTYQLSGKKPAGLLDFKEWQKLRDSVEETGEGLERISAQAHDTVTKTSKELDRLTVQARILAEVARQGGTVEQAMAILGISSWETRGYGGFAHTNPKTGEVIRGGAGEYGIGQVMPGTGKDIWTRLWRQPTEAFDETMLKDIDTNIKMMVSYFLDRYRIYGDDMRLAIDAYNKGTARSATSQYALGVQEWLEGPEARRLMKALQEGGAHIGDAWIEGLASKDADIEELAQSLTQILADYMIGQSPPPKGPLAAIDEGGAAIGEAWMEGVAEGATKGRPQLTIALEKIKALFTTVWDKVPDDVKGPIEQTIAYIADLIAQVEEALFSLDDLQAELQAVVLGGDPAGEAKSFMERLREGLEAKLDALADPIDVFTSRVAAAAATLGSVVKSIASGDWAGALLSILMETESFAKALELLGAVLGPVITLFDNILRPIIEFLLGLWNGIIDALAGISIFGWKPFAGLQKWRVEPGGGPEDEPGRRPGSGGRQVSAITGPTRDLLVDLLAPLASLTAIVGPIQDIRSILDTRLPDFGGLALAGAGAGGVSVTVEQLIVQAQSTSVDSVATASIDAIEKALASRLAFARRGRGNK